MNSEHISIEYANALKLKNTLSRLIEDLDNTKLSLSLSFKQTLQANLNDFESKIENIKILFDKNRSILSKTNINLWNTRIKNLTDYLDNAQNLFNSRLKAKSLNKKENLIELENSEYTAAENQFLHERHTLNEAGIIIDAMTQQGWESLKNLVNQKSRLKSTRKKMQSIQNTLSISGHQIKSAISRHATDRILVYSLATFTVAYTCMRKMDLKNVFNAYTKNSPEMENRTFVKLLKDAKIIDKNYTSTDADLLFASLRSKTGRKLSYECFETVIKSIAEKKKSYEDIEQQILSVGGPVYSGTKPDSVKFHDDKSLYTGVHKHGGPTTVDKGRTAFSNLSEITDRSAADVRGVNLNISKDS